MTRHRFPLLLLLLITIIPASAQQQEVTISAAASLTDVLTELQPAASQEIGARVLLNFGASGALRKQIEEGAPVDVFFSAASADMDRLESKGLILRDSRRDLLSNTLVLVGDKELKNAAGLDDLRALLASAKLLAIGDPDSVPAAATRCRRCGTWASMASWRTSAYSAAPCARCCSSSRAARLPWEWCFPRMPGFWRRAVRRESSTTFPRKAWALPSTTPSR